MAKDVANYNPSNVLGLLDCDVSDVIDADSSSEDDDLGLIEVRWTTVYICFSHKSQQQNRYVVELTEITGFTFESTRSTVNL